MINKETLNNALSVIKIRNKEANNLAYAFLQKALQNEEFRNLYSLQKQAEIENAKCEVYGEKNKYNIKDIEDQKNAVLKKLNINKNALIPHYTCTKCNDTGYVDGKMCSCLKSLINEELFKQSGLTHNLQNFNCSNFNLFNEPEKIKQIYSTMQKWCEKDSKYSIIILSGQTGVGKTYLMECMANNLISHQNIVCWTSAFNLNQSLLKFHTTFDGARLSHISNLLGADYLFIDDLGTEPILRNVTVEGIYNIISDRLEHNKKTIISTNLNLDEIENIYGERIFSRLVNKEKALCVNIENTDLRLKIKK